MSKELFLSILEKVNDGKHGTNQATYNLEHGDYYDGPMSIILEAVNQYEKEIKKKK